MNQTHRIPVLIVLIVIALFAAVVPALAYDEFDVWSFEVNLDGDNQPDFWNMHGDVKYLCFDEMLWDGYCGILFETDDERSIAYQSATEGSIATEEGIPGIADAAVSAQNLDYYRVYMGYILDFSGGTNIRIYGPVPGGTYAGWISVNGVVDINILNGNGEPERISWGILALPGDGWIFFDVVNPSIL